MLKTVVEFSTAKVYDINATKCSCNICNKKATADILTYILDGQEIPSSQ